MRRFVEEIQVRDSLIARKIIEALETKNWDDNSPVYEVDVYKSEGYDPVHNPREGYRGCAIKIFVREDVNA